MGKPERQPEGLLLGTGTAPSPERTACRLGSASRWAPCDCCGPPQSCRSKLRYYFFLALLEAMESLAALATRNFTTVLATILMAAPVAGFLSLAILAFRLDQPTDAGKDEEALLLGLFQGGRPPVSPETGGRLCCFAGNSRLDAEAVEFVSLLS